jgi:hypothetical protein
MSVPVTDQQIEESRREKGRRIHLIFGGSAEAGDERIGVDDFLCSLPMGRHRAGSADTLLQEAHQSRKVALELTE